ncbi:MAG: IPExxxVDY family protein [Crocinitomicaceae bacterium]|nr:IPExxxVDY family protein [Crocinitomicaceae bacterium]
MTKYKLFDDDEIQEFYDFELIGICSSFSDYRLSWNINKCLQISLEKQDDYCIKTKKKGEDGFHSFYQFTHELEMTEYYLIKNVSSSFKRLIPEQDQIDYFLLLKNNVVHNLEEILEKLKTSEGIETAFIFDPNELKSRSNLLF